MKKRINILILIVSVVFILYNCGLFTDDKTKFYTAKANWDHIRIPLIWPYDLSNNSNNFTNTQWGLFHYYEGSMFVGGVVKFDIDYPYIFIMEKNLRSNIFIYRIFNVTNQVSYTNRILFINKIDFDNYLQSNQIELPRWRYEPEKMLESFSKSNYLPWIPEKYIKKKSVKNVRK